MNIYISLLSYYTKDTFYQGKEGRKGKAVFILF